MTTDTQGIQQAMLEFHAAFSGVKKTGINPHFNSQHFTLDEVVRVTTPHLTKAGLFVFHTLDGSTLRTTVMHLSGESISSSGPVKTTGTEQQLGSSVTYMKRYNLCCLLNIAEADDDGNAATAAVHEPPPPVPATKEQMAAINDHIEAGNVPEATVKHLEKNKGKITQKQADTLLAKLQEKS